MKQSTDYDVQVPEVSATDLLTQVLKQGAYRLLAQAVEAEVGQWVADHVHQRDEQGLRQVVRNGYLPSRSILTGLGPVEVRQPRVRDHRP